MKNPVETPPQMFCPCNCGNLAMPGRRFIHGHQIWITNKKYPNMAREAGRKGIAVVLKQYPNHQSNAAKRRHDIHGRTFEEYRLERKDAIRNSEYKSVPLVILISLAELEEDV